MVRRLKMELSESGDGLDILDDENGDYIDYADFAALEAREARLREELHRVRQCYLTLREGRGLLPDEEINPGCYESDLMRVECKKMAAMREALRECVKDYDKNLIFEAFPDNPFSASIQKAREVLGDD